MSVIVTPEKKLTRQQLNAMHLYFRLLAKQMNDAGYDVKKILSFNPIEIPWTEYNVKELLWREVQKAMTGIHSTTKITSKDVTDIYEVVDRHICTTHGIPSVPFPSNKPPLVKLIR